MTANYFVLTTCFFQTHAQKHYQKKLSAHLQVHVVELRQISADDLIRVHKDHARHIKWKEDIQEENLVSPYDALLVCLLVEPVGPLICDKLVVKAVLLCHGRDDALVMWGHVVLDDPELEPAGPSITRGQIAGPTQSKRELEQSIPDLYTTNPQGKATLARKAVLIVLQRCFPASKAGLGEQTM
jgi:hypothetical protein